MDDVYLNARQFIYSRARLVERLLFSVLFENTNPSAVGHLIAAYQNADGGLGFGLEPDLRCSESQPLFVEFGLSVLRDAGWRDQELALSMCSFLESVSDASGLVPVILPNAFESPHAAHWNTIGPPALNPTAGICGLLHYQGIEHPWLTRATQSCSKFLLEMPLRDAHTLVSASRLAEYLPDRGEAELITERIALSLNGASFFIPYAPAVGYGLTPLHLSQTPASRWRRLFSDEQIEGHLNDLIKKQQPDGGWPITWEAPGPAATCEWRGCLTLAAITTLIAYGRMSQ